ncbi:hypothetical protein OIU85_019837 [Salix viminalis]|uniref:Reverse transcriptase zinc-binding domain-containing protein n=1 Tax=Salix viminalis TaxID=40686 RepID=A0A9Q0ZKH0_SALVM|nr:hypothetical protein OIU85_019837 [Salix viminalis]
MQAHHVGVLWDRLTSIPNHQMEDEVLWSATPSGKFTIASAWDMLRERRPVTNIHSILWHPLHIPRHSFILWLAAQCRLRTMDKMDYLHLEDTRCKLCNHEEESHEHLFFQCRFSSQVWRRITGHAKIFWPPLAWGSLIDWTANKYHNNKLVHQMIGPLLLAAAVYHLWQERNRRVFHNNPRTIHLLCEDIYQQIRIQPLLSGVQAFGQWIVPSCVELCFLLASFCIFALFNISFCSKKKRLSSDGPSVATLLFPDDLSGEDPRLPSGGPPDECTTYCRWFSGECITVDLCSRPLNLSISASGSSDLCPSSSVSAPKVSDLHPSSSVAAPRGLPTDGFRR